MDAGVYSRRGEAAGSEGAESFPVGGSTFAGGHHKLTGDLTLSFDKPHLTRNCWDLLTGPTALLDCDGAGPRVSACHLLFVRLSICQTCQNPVSKFVDMKARFTMNQSRGHRRTCSHPTLN